jgi:hypothetical protein
MVLGVLLVKTPTSRNRVVAVTRRFATTVTQSFAEEAQRDAQDFFDSEGLFPPQNQFNGL